MEKPEGKRPLGRYGRRWDDDDDYGNNNTNACVCGKARNAFVTRGIQS
jgi:hypothetical protein